MQASVRGFAAGVALLSLGACGDSVTSPTPATPRTLSPSGPAFDYTSTSSSPGNVQFDFAVGSRGGSFSIAGLYTINFPENSVCDPDRSSYGATEWDKACSTLDDGQAIKVHATLTLTSAGLAIDFSPALRFSPTTQVTISTDIFASMIKTNRDYILKHPDVVNPLAIFYSSTLGASAVNDFSSDRSVLTHIDLTTGRIWRRVKHFSGYSMTSGQSCEPSPDNPDCVLIDGHG